MDKIKETFEHMNDNWKEEEYRKCLVEWKQIQSFITKEETASVIHNTIQNESKKIRTLKI